MCAEQDIGFQGRHRYKQQLTFKNMGDGFCFMLYVQTGTHKVSTSGIKLRQIFGLKKVIPTTCMSHESNWTDTI